MPLDDTQYPESFDAKAKGEKFQKDLVALIQEVLPEHKDVIVSSLMSAHGEVYMDIMGSLRVWVLRIIETNTC